MEMTIKSIIQDLFDTDIDVQLTHPDKKFGDYASNVAMQLAGQLGIAPRDIAQQIADRLANTPGVTEVSVAGPGFLNIRLSARFLSQHLQNQWSDSYGENADGAGRTVVVEYPSPNMAKPYSVGHLRPGNQGWAARRLMEATGWRVITDNHLGDYGAPLGIWITGFRHFSSEDALARDGVYELGRVYIETKKALKDESERGKSALSDEVQSWLLKFESGDAEAVAYSDRFKDISMNHIHDVMARLKISTDYELGEAFFAPLGKQAVGRLLDQAIAIKNNDGSVIVPLDDQGIDVPLLVQKSNGAALYATTDLATMLYRQENWHPDKVIYAVGSEQKFYFSQLFALARKLKISTEFIHLWFGFINQRNDDGTVEKMSSRKGVVLMEELLDEAESRARRVVEGRDVTDDDVKKIALGAIKYSDFVSDRRTDILFDWDTIFALSGHSGPYVQYAGVRANKILNQYGQGAHEPDYDYETEKDLIIKILEYPDVVRLAARELEPHRVAGYVYELAREFNRYYESVPIASSEVGALVKEARLGVLAKISIVIKHGLDILGIEVPDKM